MKNTKKFQGNETKKKENNSIINQYILICLKKIVFSCLSCHKNFQMVDDPKQIEKKEKQSSELL